jgi:uncharacterized repeat protein (TIGR02543 family)
MDLEAGTYYIEISQYSSYTGTYDLTGTVLYLNAIAPTITEQPVGAIYDCNATATALSVTATSIDGGTLSYQWFRNTANSTTDGTSVGTDSTYTPLTTSVGTYYYYVIVTNTNNSVTGNKMATATSSPAVAVTVNPLTPRTITFNANGGTVTPETGMSDVDGTVSPLPTPTKYGYTFNGWFSAETGGDEVTESTVFNADAIIHAQWTLNTYTVTFKDHDGAVLKTETVNHGSSATAPPSPTRDGYTFAVWDVAFDNVVSDMAVTATYTTSILSHDRIIPVIPETEAVVIAPVNILASEFTAGPNPVAKSAEKIRLFRQGKAILDGTLTIYDASGNVINKIKITDKFIGAQSRRQVGEWNLKDAKGRPVADGTYLAKGTVRTVDGKREKVSVVLGVR